MRFVQTGLMVAGLYALPLTAQPTAPSPAPSDMTRETPMPRTTDVDDNDFNFGWLGLLGLAGLAGLGRKKDHTHTDHVHHTDVPRDRTLD
jgi:MYXO-CTERM domain-containing protein